MAKKETSDLYNHKLSRKWKPFYKRSTWKSSLRKCNKIWGKFRSVICHLRRIRRDLFRNSSKKGETEIIYINWGTIVYYQHNIIRPLKHLNPDVTVAYFGSNKVNSKDLKDLKTTEWKSRRCQISFYDDKYFCL